MTKKAQGRSSSSSSSSSSSARSAASSEASSSSRSSSRSATDDGERQQQMNVQDLFNEILGESYRRLCLEEEADHQDELLTPETMFTELQSWAVDPESEDLGSPPPQEKQQKGKRKQSDHYFQVEQVKKRAYLSHQREQGLKEEKERLRQNTKAAEKGKAKEKELAVKEEAEEAEEGFDVFDSLEDAFALERQETLQEETEEPKEDYTPLQGFLEETLPMFDFDPATFEQRDTESKPDMLTESQRREKELADKLEEAEKHNRLLQERLELLEASNNRPAPQHPAPTKNAAPEGDPSSSMLPSMPVDSAPNLGKRPSQRGYSIGFSRNPRQPGTNPIPAFSPKFFATPEFQHIIAALIFLTYMTSLFTPTARAAVLPMALYPGKDLPLQFPVTPNGTTELPFKPESPNGAFPEPPNYITNYGGDEDGVKIPPFKIAAKEVDDERPKETKAGDKPEEEEGPEAAAVAREPPRKLFVFPEVDLAERERPEHEEDPRLPLDHPGLLIPEGEEPEHPDFENPDVMFAQAPRIPSAVVLFFLLGMLGIQRKKEADRQGLGLGLAA